MVSEWVAFVVREADTAFARGAYLASILTSVASVETYLRSEALASKGVTLAALIDEAVVSEDLRKDLHVLRQYRNRWVHVEAPWDDAAVLSDPTPFENELEEMAKFAARTMRRALYANQWT